MLPRSIPLLLFLCFLHFDAVTCTTFLLHRGNELVFGRNYDWVTGNGFVCTNQRGLQKKSAVRADGKPLEWTSKYGSITFNQYGKEFPTGGMNEKGLVVELMWLEESRYAIADNRPAIDVLQWIQYQLDCHSTVSEVIATDKHVRINNGDVPLHYLIADKTGASATIEFLNGKMITHTNAELELPVLTNETYDKSLDAMKRGATGGNNSHQRFTTACAMLQDYRENGSNKPASDVAFNMLSAVSQGDFTKWSIVYDIKKSIISFRTFAAPGIKIIDFSSFNFDCKNPSVMLDMNSADVGNISRLLFPYSTASNFEFLTRSAEETRSRIDISNEEIEAQGQFPAEIKCRN
jgi:penicillin V acylase-like amidase (Ntn superfamily)